MEIMDVKEVADYLKFSTKKVYQLIQCKTIPYKKIGGQYRFIRNEIDKWIYGERPVIGLVKEKETTYSADEDVSYYLDKIKSLNNQLKKQLYIVAMLTKMLNKYNIKPVVVGGLAVEFYTAGGYNTGDIDLVFPDNKLLGEILEKIGYKKEGRHWINMELDSYIESPSSKLKPEETKNIVELDIEGLQVYLIGVEDLIIDRLNSYVFWKCTDDGYWVKELIFMHNKKINWEYLNGRSKEERTYTALIKLKKEMDNKNEKDKLR